MNDYALAKKASLDWKELNLIKKLVNCNENFYRVCVCVCMGGYGRNIYVSSI